MYDTIETLGASVIQHGKSSDRLYLMKLDAGDFPEILGRIHAIAEEQRYGKIFAKIPAWAEKGFEGAGFSREAFVPGFYNGQEDCVFMAQYLRPDRAHLDSSVVKTIAENVALAEQKSRTPKTPVLPEGYVLRKLLPDDAEQLTSVYRIVFASYPFPIYEPEYIIGTMEQDIIEYYGVFAGDTLVAASSSEMDKKSLNVEMTDFATLPDYLGHGFAVSLLMRMEDAMLERGMKTLYTIARAMSAGMNITFARRGYLYSGTLVNNTNISGSIESMNVWYKTVTKKKDI